MDVGRLVLAGFGLIVTCVVAFVLGAAMALVVPPSYLGTLAGARHPGQPGALGTPSSRATSLPFRATSLPFRVRSSRLARYAAIGQGPLATEVARQILLVMGSEVSYQHGHRASRSRTRSDTLLVVAVDGPEHRLEILSIPPATRCSIPGHGSKPIEDALALGGPRLALQAVSDLIRMPIDHWILLRVGGLVQLIDALGGVDFDVPEPMRYTDHAAGLHIDLERGYQHLDGNEAQKLIRFRHDVMGDIGRVGRQQLFMRAVANKVLSPAGLAMLPRWVHVFGKVVETDMGVRQIAQLAGWARTLAPTRIEMAMLSGTSGPHGVWTVNPGQAGRDAAALFGAPRPPVKGLPAARRLATHVVVLNGTRRVGLAGEAARRLRAAGWTIWQVGDADRFDYQTTRVEAETDDAAEAGAIGRVLGVSASVRSAWKQPRPPRSIDLADVDYVVIVGQDFLDALRARTLARR